MCKTTLLYLICLLVSLVPNQSDGLFWEISREGWLELEELQDYICGLSLGYTDHNYTRGIGWFCVPSANCSTSKPVPSKLPGSSPGYSCQSLRYNEGRDECCYIGSLSPPLHVPIDDYSVYIFTKNTSIEEDITSLNEYKEFLNFQQSTEIRAEVLKTHEVCGLIPSGKRDFATFWSPYICVEESQCEERHAIFTPLRFGAVGDRFCSRSQSERKVCCHLSGPVDPINKQLTWAYKELHPEQKFAPGFRSSFMCEQYNRLVCDGKYDRCALRTLYRDEPRPAEFPHQALIGVLSFRIQFFHCAGSLISKDWILSAYDCRSYQGLKASIALLGEYKLSDNFKPINARDRETNPKEQITYIKKHYSKVSSNFLILFRLWRPLKLNHYLRPACLDWFSKPVTNFQTYNFSTGWLTGYGPIGKSDVFNDDIKRYQFKFARKRELDDKCAQRVPDSKRMNSSFSLQRSTSHICLNSGQPYSAILQTDEDPKSSQGYFDMGAPFNVLEYYCRWNIFGVSIQKPEFSSQPPTLIELIPNSLAWIENIVWKDDFDLLDFNLSWPSCGDPMNYTFHNMNFLNRDYNQWFYYAYK